MSKAETRTHKVGLHTMCERDDWRHDAASVIDFVRLNKRTTFSITTLKFSCMMDSYADRPCKAPYVIRNVSHPPVQPRPFQYANLKFCICWLLIFSIQYPRKSIYSENESHHLQHHCLHSSAFASLVQFHHTIHLFQ